MSSKNPAQNALKSGNMINGTICGQLRIVLSVFGTLQCVKEIGAAALAPAPSMSNYCFDLNLKNENFVKCF